MPWVRDERGRFAGPTVRCMTRRAYRARLADLVAPRMHTPGFALWVRGARESWNPADGPNPFERVQLPMEIAS